MRTKVKVEARNFTQKVTVQSPTISRDAYGGEIVAYATAATEWAEIREAGSIERFAPIADQLQAVYSHVVRLRCNLATAAITPRYRLLWGTRTLEVDTANPDDARSVTVLRCTEVL